MDIGETRREGYASLTNDYMFKRIFGSEECKDILIAFLNRIVGNGEITDVVFLNTEHLGPTADDRKAVFDISVRTQLGEEYIVEMQLAQQAYFRDRALFYTGYPVIHQAERAKEKYIDEHGDSAGFRWDFKLKPVRFIGVVNFSMKHGEGWSSGRYHSSYRLHEDETGEVLHDKLQFIFLELARFDKAEDELEDYYDKWMYLFKNMNSLKRRPDVFVEKEFDRLFDMAKICNFTPEQYNNYQEAQKMIYDYENTIDFARQEGVKQGLEQGRQEGHLQGLAEGELKKALEVARTMKGLGIELDLIVKSTGLSEEEIRKLQIHQERL
ncbi:MAG: Rpn family recombination-promoting nuclease/putative transposase [Bacteroidales bacterium]|nr:Rpn family recombination-promoting nuclease/putative transposase [Bacteroidales bacterium]